MGLISDDLQVWESQAPGPEILVLTFSLSDFIQCIFASGPQVKSQPYSVPSGWMRKIRTILPGLLSLILRYDLPTFHEDMFMSKYSRLLP